MNCHRNHRRRREDEEKKSADIELYFPSAAAVAAVAKLFS